MAPAYRPKVFLVEDVWRHRGYLRKQGSTSRQAQIKVNPIAALLSQLHDMLRGGGGSLESDGGTSGCWTYRLLNCANNRQPDDKQKMRRRGLSDEQQSRPRKRGTRLKRVTGSGKLCQVSGKEARSIVDPRCAVTVLLDDAS